MTDTKQYTLYESFEPGRSARCRVLIGLYCTTARACIVRELINLKFFATCQIQKKSQEDVFVTRYAKWRYKTISLKGEKKAIQKIDY